MSNLVYFLLTHQEIKDRLHPRDQLCFKIFIFRSEFLQQNIESRKLFDEMEERLSLLQNQSEMFGNEQDERVTIKSDSWEFKEKMPGI